MLFLSSRSTSSGPFLIMYGHFLRALRQHSGSLCVASYGTHFLQHGRCINRRSNLHNIVQQMTVVQGTQKQWLHASVPPSNTPEKKPLDEHSPQLEDPLQKESEKVNPTSVSSSTPESVSSGEPSASTEPDTVETDPLQDQSLSLIQRFKRTFKQYGKVLIPVHLVTSSIWFGSFYYAAIKGVNVVPFLEFIGLPESIVGILKNSQSGNALTAYALYKISTPARYTVTLGGTSISVKYLRKYGYMSTPPPVKDYIQDRMEETKERFTGKIGETRDIISGKMGETKDLISGKIQETKDKVSFMKKKE